MARKKKKKDAEGFQVNSGAFVPATQESGAFHTKAKKASKGDKLTAQAASSPVPGSFEQYSRGTADYSNRKSKRMSTGAKVAIVILIIALVAGVAALGSYIYKESYKAQVNADLHNMSSSIMEAIDNELTGMTTFEEPFTVLLLGSDARADDPDMGARTDTIILCRIDPTKNIVSMVSIPRDTKIEIPGYGTNKFNAAYSYGGPSGTIVAVKNLCGVDIDHYAEVNFEGLVGLVDAIGGIDVYVEEEVNDPDAGDVVIPAGQQHLDGAAALTFSRSRAYVDGDFTRVSNQRKVIEAIVHKGLEAPASELYGLIQASTKFLTTDSAMDVDFIFSLADQIRHNNDYPFQLYSATIPASTDMIDGVSYVIADEKGVKDLMKVFLAGGDVGSQSSGVEGVLKDEEEAGSETGTASSSASSIISSSSSYGSSASSGYQTRSST